MKKAAIVSFYWDTMGGGEKYMAMVAKTLQASGYVTEIWWKDSNILSLIQERHGLLLPDITVNPKAYLTYKNGHLWQKWRLEKGFDLLFVLTDGSIPWLFGRKNFIHFQVPFHDVGGHSLVTQLKLRNITCVVCNSQFTKSWIDKEFLVKSRVVYPPISTFPPLPKENLILAVGRFDNLLHAKRQDILIEAFKALNVPGWKLIIAGGLLHDTGILQQLRTLAKGMDIEILPNPNYMILSKLYGKAQLFWHAAGYGSPLNTHPEKAEHFGMVTLEAMSAGAIPLVYAGGGQLEIISHGKNGFLWKTPDELVAYTHKLIHDQTTGVEIMHAATRRSHDFCKEVFERSITNLLVS